MKHLFDKTSTDEILSRIDMLTPDTKGKWGKMNVTQMIAHCQSPFELATSDKKMPRPLMSYLFGKMFKKSFVNEEPFRKNLPTDKTFIATDVADFETEKKRLTDIIKKFVDGGESKINKHPHPFFGTLTPQEWSRGMYKHLDHHLVQFGV